MKNKWIWISIIIITLIGGTFYFRGNIFRMMRGQSRAGNTAQAQDGKVSATGVISTTTIRSAVDSSQVSAAGNIEIANPLSAIALLVPAGCIPWQATFSPSC